MTIGDLSSWGGHYGDTVFNVLTVFAVRENTVRVVFTQSVYFSKILDLHDAFNPGAFAVAPIAGTFDGLGVAARAVNVLETELATSESVPPVLDAEVGYFLDIIVDRPLSSFPARYTLTCTSLQNAAKSIVLATDTHSFDGVYRELQGATLERPGELRDLANAQTGAQLATEVPDELRVLGSYLVVDGDYAFDEGNTGRKKRIFRRILTKKGGFAHLPGYGLGVRDRVKRLARFDVVGRLSTEATLQIQREPDVAKAIVTVDFGSKPNLMRMHVGVRPRGGKSQKFTVSVPLK